MAPTDKGKDKKSPTAKSTDAARGLIYKKQATVDGRAIVHKSFNSLGGELKRCVVKKGVATFKPRALLNQTVEIKDNKRTATGGEAKKSRGALDFTSPKQVENLLHFAPLQITGVPDLEQGTKDDFWRFLRPETVKELPVHHAHIKNTVGLVDKKRKRAKGNDDDGGDDSKLFGSFEKTAPLMCGAVSRFTARIVFDATKIMLEEKKKASQKKFTLTPEHIIKAMEKMRQHTTYGKCAFYNMDKIEDALKKRGVTN